MPDPIIYAEPSNAGLDEFKKAVDNGSPGLMTRVFNHATQTDILKNEIQQMYAASTLAETFPENDVEELLDYGNDCLVVLRENIPPSLSSPFDSSGTKYKPELYDLAAELGLSEENLKKIEQYHINLVKLAAAKSTESNWVEFVVNKHIPEYMQKAQSLYGEKVLQDMLLGAAQYSLSENAMGVLGRSVGGVISSLDTNYRLARNSFYGNLESLNELDQSNVTTQALKQMGNNIKENLKTNPLVDTALFYHMVKLHKANPELSMEEISASANATVNADKSPKKIAKLDSFAPAASAAPAPAPAAENRYQKSFNRIFSINDVPPANIASAILEYPQKNTLAEWSYYIFTAKFILAPVKNLLKVVAEYVPTVIQDTALYLNDGARKSYTDANAIKNPLAFAIVKAGAGLGILATGAVFGLAKGVELLTGSVTSPMRSFRDAWRIHPILGVTSAVVSIATTAAVAFFATPALLGLLPLAGSATVTAIALEVSSGLATIAAPVLSFTGLSGISLLTSNLAAVGAGLLGAGFALLASPAKLASSKIWTYLSREVTIPAPEKKVDSRPVTPETPPSPTIKVTEERLTQSYRSISERDRQRAARKSLKEPLITEDDSPHQENAKEWKPRRKSLSDLDVAENGIFGHSLKEHKEESKNLAPDVHTGPEKKI